MELEQLKEALIAQLLNAEDIHKKYLVIGNTSYSCAELALEIYDESEVGKQMIKNVVQLALDLIIRQKKIM